MAGRHVTMKGEIGKIVVFLAIVLFSRYALSIPMPALGAVLVLFVVGTFVWDKAALPVPASWPRWPKVLITLALAALCVALAPSGAGGGFLFLSLYAWLVTYAGAQVRKHTILLTLVLGTIYPVVYMVVTSFKSNAQIYAHFWEWPLPQVLREKLDWGVEPHPDNYRRAWHAVAPNVLNSLVVSSATLFGLLFFASLSAYVFARYEFRGKQVIFYAVLALLMVPGVLTLIPAAVLVMRLHLFNNLLGLIIPYMSGGQVFAIFILRGFFEAIPQDYFDAARIDGAGEFQVYRRIVLPLSKPILGTVAIMNVMSTWNDYIWPLVVISSEKLRTVAVGLTHFRSEYLVRQGHMMAGNVMGSIPIVILFLLTMRMFIKGLSSGGLKV